LENAFAEGARVVMHRSGAQGEALSDEALIRFRTGAGGAGTPHVVAVALDYLPEALARSTNAISAKVSTKIRRKASLGKSRPVSVANALTGAASK
jgi:hypothetical protein